MDVVGNLSGLPGLFVAGVFSGALSALSSGMNSVALVVLEDFIKPFRPNLSDRTAVRITKGLALAVGIICFAAVFMISQVKTILDATLSLTGAYGGAILGVFTLGMCFPWANAIVSSSIHQLGSILKDFFYQTVPTGSWDRDVRLVHPDDVARLGLPDGQIQRLRPQPDQILQHGGLSGVIIPIRMEQQFHG